MAYTLALKWKSTPDPTLLEVILFLGSKRSIKPSQNCKLEAQKNFQISQAIHGLNNETKMEKVEFNKDRT